MGFKDPAAKIVDWFDQQPAQATTISSCLLTSLSAHPVVFADCYLLSNQPGIRETAATSDISIRTKQTPPTTSAQNCRCVHSARCDSRNHSYELIRESALPSQSRYETAGRVYGNARALSLTAVPKFEYSSSTSLYEGSRIHLVSHSIG